MMSSPKSMVGQNETCPDCGNVTIVPQATITEDRPWYPPVERSVGKRWSGLAIAGFVVALCSFPFRLPEGTFGKDVELFLYAVTFGSVAVAISLSAVGIAQVSSGKRQRGMGLGIAGLVIGSLGLVLLIMYLLVGG